MPVLFFSPLASLSRTLRVIASFPCLLPWSHLRKTDRRHGKSGCVAEPNADPAWVLLMFARLSQRCCYPVRSTHTLLALYRTVSLLPRHLCGVFFVSSFLSFANFHLSWCKFESVMVFVLQESSPCVRVLTLNSVVMQNLAPQRVFNTMLQGQRFTSVSPVTPYQRQGHKSTITPRTHVPSSLLL